MATSSDKRAFEISDLYKIENISGIAVSDDGQMIAVARTVNNMKKGKSTTKLDIIDTDSKKLVTSKSMAHCEIVRWKDMNVLYIKTSDNSKMKKGRYGSKTQLWEVDIRTWSRRMVTNFSMGIGEVKVSRDDSAVIFSSEVYPKASSDSDKNYMYNKLHTKGPIQAHVADRLLYRHWATWNDGRLRHIIKMDINSGDYTDMTPGENETPIFMLGGGNGMDISPDGTEICYSSNRTRHPESNTNSNVYTSDINGDNVRNITEENEGWDGDAQYSPDGSRIAYKEQRTPGYESDMINLIVYYRKTGKKRNLTEELDNWVVDYRWSHNGRHIYFTAEAPSERRLYMADTDSGDIVQLTEGQTVAMFDTAKDGTVYFTASTIDKPSALYMLRKGEKSPVQLTRYNDKIEKKTDLRDGERFTVKGAKGDDIEVYVIKPHGFDSTKKYPLILNVHGGPQQQWTNSFRGDWQVYPGRGYVVAFCNPHGSTGYGQQFTRDISGDWGGAPYEDLMKVCDELEKLEYVDKERMGAMGWSFGGYMMNWMQAKTKRFKCLASMMGVYNLKSMWGATEELWFPNFDLEGRPWESDQYERFSPSEYVNDFSTPTLIITGEKDFRVPYTQSLEYFTALQSKDIDSELIVFKNDGHWPDNVKSMPLYYAAHLRWFHKYLGGGDSPYDIEELWQNRGKF